MISDLNMLLVVAVDTAIVAFAYGFFLARMMKPPASIKVTPILPG